MRRQVKARRRPRVPPATTRCASDSSPARSCLTAHHADDQMETVLLQWLRGGGLRAIAGMPRIARFGANAWHARPLLSFTRAELLEWAEQQHLQWEEDPSNTDTRFDRNYLRLEVLPAVRRRWPAAARTIGRVADHARDGIESEDALARAGPCKHRSGQRTRPAVLARTVRCASTRRCCAPGCEPSVLPLPSAQSLAALRHDIAVAAPRPQSRRGLAGRGRASLSQSAACAAAGFDRTADAASGSPRTTRASSSRSTTALELVAGSRRRV